MIKNIMTINIDIVCSGIMFGNELRQLAFAESYDGFTNLIDINGEEYAEFIHKIKRTLENIEFLLNDEHSSNRSDSISMYYEFLKFNEDATLKVVLYIRISDHDVRRKQIQGHTMLNKNRMYDYVKDNRIPKLRQDFGNITYEEPETLEIIIDGQHFPSYDDAWKYFDRFVKSRLNRY